MSTVPSPISIVIDRLAAGPTAPAGGAGSTPLRTRVAEVVAQMGPAPWARRIIADERNLVTLIASPPGGGNRPHWHREFDEWWVVLGGRLEWELTGGLIVQATKVSAIEDAQNEVYTILDQRHEVTAATRDYTVQNALASNVQPPGEQIVGFVDGTNVWHYQDDAVTGSLRYTNVLGTPNFGIFQPPANMSPTNYQGGGVDGPSSTPGVVGIDAFSKDLAFNLYTTNPTSPEPGTCFLFVCGSLGMALAHRRRHG